MQKHMRSPLASVVWIGFLLAVVAALLTAGPGPFYRLQLLSLRDAFTLLRWGAWLGLAAAIVSLAGLWIARWRRDRRGLALAIVGSIAGALAFGVPFAMLVTAKKVPPIHDISTDTVSPPVFVGVLPLRKDAPNSVQYGGAHIARQQQQAYPDLRPVILKVSAPQAFERALQTARDLGWEIVAAVPSEGRIEATDATLWWGFKDDVVIRVVTDGEGSRVDVRSVSRVGVSDLGKNAQRVRAFLARLGR